MSRALPPKSMVRLAAPAAIQSTSSTVLALAVAEGDLHGAHEHRLAAGAEGELRYAPGLAPEAEDDALLAAVHGLAGEQLEVLGFGGAGKESGEQEKGELQLTHGRVLHGFRRSALRLRGGRGADLRSAYRGRRPKMVPARRRVEGHTTTQRFILRPSARGIHSSSCSGASDDLDPRDKPEDDSGKVSAGPRSAPPPDRLRGRCAVP